MDGKRMSKPYVPYGTKRYRDKGWVVQFSATHRGGLSWFFFRGNRHTFDKIDNKGNSSVTIKASDTLKNEPTVWHVHIHITLAVAAMDSCFWLIRPHQHGIADGQKWD